MMRSCTKFPRSLIRTTIPLPLRLSRTRTNAQRQGFVRRGHGMHVKDFTAAGGASVKVAAVTAGDPLLFETDRA